MEDQGGLQKEGIYRVSGRQSNLDALKVDFEKDASNVNLNSYDVFTIASVIKVYLREMEFPLFALPIKYRAEYSSKFISLKRNGWMGYFRIVSLRRKRK